MLKHKSKKPGQSQLKQADKIRQQASKQATEKCTVVYVEVDYGRSGSSGIRERQVLGSREVGSSTGSSS